MDFEIDTVETTLPGAWQKRASHSTDWPGVSTIWLGELQILSATSVSVWQHVQLSEQICPRDTLDRCWGVKQPTKNKHLRPWLRLNVSAMRMTSEQLTGSGSMARTARGQMQAGFSLFLCLSFASPTTIPLRNVSVLFPPFPPSVSARP